MTTIRSREDELFSRWSAGRDSFSPDGLADEGAYLETKTRVLFLLKEVNDETGSNFDLRDFVRAGGRVATWNTITRWVRAFRAREVDSQDRLPWSLHGRVSEADRCKHLPSIGAMNLKKSAGTHTTDPQALREAGEADAVFLNEQIELYDPNLIVCCGSEVTGLTRNIPALVRGEWEQTLRGVWYRRLSDTCVMFDHCHPAARVSEHLKFYSLLDAVEEAGAIRA